MINWDVSESDRLMAIKIAKKAAQLFNVDMLTMEMDIIACHANGNPLRLKDLLDAEGYDFTHDVLGIRQHMDRKTGKLQNFFVPRFSVSDKGMI